MKPTPPPSLTPEELLTQLKRLIRLQHELESLFPEVTSQLLLAIARLHERQEI